MITADLVIVQPEHVVFPLFRKIIDENNIFVNIYISFHNGNMKNNFKNFIINSLPSNIVAVKPYNDKDDWRNNCLTSIMRVDPYMVRKGSHFLFIEQDFLFNKEVIDEIILTDEDFIYFNSDGRIHPAFALINKDLVYKTSLDFSARPEQGYDHFGLFFQEVKKLCKGKDLLELGLVEKEDFFHMSGLTQNYYLHELKRTFHHKDDFLTYVKHTIDLPNQDPRFLALNKEIILDNPDFTEVEYVSRFFPKNENIN